MSVVTPADLLRRVAADLVAWTTDYKKTVNVAEDAYDALYQLATSPGGVRLVLNWEGETNLSDVPDVFMVAQRIAVLVGVHEGMDVDPGKVVHTATADRPALLDLTAQVRARMLSQLWDTGTTGRYWLYKGAEVARLPAGDPLRAYRLTFEIETTQAAVTDRAVSA